MIEMEDTICQAIKYNKEKCTKVKLENSNYCKIHTKIFDTKKDQTTTAKPKRNRQTQTEKKEETKQTSIKSYLDIITIQNIPFYVDEDLFIYQHEDVKDCIINPRKIGKAIRNENDEYIFAEL